jgi:alpha-galactosidase
MISINSELYKNHKEYALTSPLHDPLFSRNQLLLNLTLTKVQDYIISSITHLLSTYNITYVKWDMNRNIADFYSSNLSSQGEFYHKYILGLYRVLNSITSQFPNVLFESCASGGNRTDLGMLYYMNQIWLSDDTDPVERIRIQNNLSYLYPLSIMSNHVSGAPHSSTLRNTLLSTRFNVASFGVLGYEFDLRKLNRNESIIVKDQISWYKEHRTLLQKGTLLRFDDNQRNQVQLQVQNEEESILLSFNNQIKAVPPLTNIKVKQLDNNKKYIIKIYPKYYDIKAFGNLVFYALKSNIAKSLLKNKVIYHLVNKVIKLNNPNEEYIATGKALMKGIPLTQGFMGTGYDSFTRVEMDYSSELYLIKEINKEGING